MYRGSGSGGADFCPQLLEVGYVQVLSELGRGAVDCANVMRGRKHTCCNAGGLCGGGAHGALLGTRAGLGAG